MDFLEIIRDQVADAEDESALFELSFALMSGELSRLLQDVQRALQDYGKK